MSKKVKLVDVKEVEVLLGQGSSRKLENLIARKQLTREAARLLAGDTEMGFCNKTIRKYDFYELYETLTDFVTSKAFFKLMNYDESQLVAEWIPNFYSCSAEMMSDYNRMESGEAKHAFYMFVFCVRYFSKRLGFPVKFANDYLNCMDALCEIFNDNNNSGDKNAKVFNLAPFIQRVQFLNMNGIKCAMKHFDAADTPVVSSVLCRMRIKKGETTTAYEIYEIMGLIDSLPEITDEVLRQAFLIMAFSSQTNPEIEIAFKTMYDKYLHELFKAEKDISKLDKHSYFGDFSPVYTYEKDEEVLNRVFDYSVESLGYYLVSNKIDYIAKTKPVELKITDHMVEESIKRSTTWGGVLLNKKIDTVEEVKRIRNMVCAGGVISNIGSYPLVVKHLNLANFSKEEIKEMAEQGIIDWYFIGGCFENGIIPFDFLIENIELIAEGRYFNSRSSLIEYTPEQLLRLLDFVHLYNDKAGVIINVIMQSKDATDEMVAQALGVITSFNKHQNPFYFERMNDSLDLRNILTLI